MREKMQKRIVNLVKTEPLTLWDMIILTLIMFGGAIYSSNIVFFSKIDQGIIEHLNLEFGYMQNGKYGRRIVLAIGCSNVWHHVFIDVYNRFSLA